MAAAHATEWAPESWRTRPVRQLPNYPDAAALHAAERGLRQRPPLVLPEEILALRRQLAEVARGNAFLLQGGDCAESFDDLGEETVGGNYRLLLQMALVLTFAAACPVVKLGRVAGQYAKPRSSDTETIDGVTLPSYRGDIINGTAFDAGSRTPDPRRLLDAYSHAAATLNLLRAMSKGGASDLSQVHAWTSDFLRNSAEGARYQSLADSVTDSLTFMRACGFDRRASNELHEVSFYTSHEALHLNYEQALTRQAASDGSWYGGSGHMLWLGERTREPDGAHVEYLRGIVNPVGIKLGPGATPEQLLRLLDRLDPHDEPGRIVLITRMGAARVHDALPPLIRAMQRESRLPVWCCDPMHGNTLSASTGHKTRDFGSILAEIQAFFSVHVDEGSWAGGLHVEMTSQDVTECRGGAQALTDERLGERYRTTCDPRLNGSQSLEVAFLVADMLRRRPPLRSPSGVPVPAR